VPDPATGANGAATVMPALSPTSMPSRLQPQQQRAASSMSTITCDRAPWTGRRTGESLSISPSRDVFERQIATNYGPAKKLSSDHARCRRASRRCRHCTASLHLHHCATRMAAPRRRAAKPPHSSRTDGPAAAAVVAHLLPPNAACEQNMLPARPATRAGRRGDCGVSRSIGRGR